MGSTCKKCEETAKKKKRFRQRIRIGLRLFKRFFHFSDLILQKKCGDFWSQIVRFCDKNLTIFLRTYSVKQNQDRKIPVAPVLTFVLYYGKDHWNYPTNLKDGIRVPEVFDEFVNDYNFT